MWNLILQCWHLIHRCGRLVCVWKQVFLCGLGRPGMHCVARADLKLLIFLFHSLSGRVIVLFHHAKFNFKRIDSRPNKEGFWGTNSDVQLFGELPKSGVWKKQGQEFVRLRSHFSKSIINHEINDSHHHFYNISYALLLNSPESMVL